MQKQKTIIPQHLSIQAFRDNGYKDAAHALAELIDNSVQAGERVPGITEVELLCVDKVGIVEKRSRRRINQIAVLDNACGMDAEILQAALQFGNGTHLDPDSQDGIGKFGMGLPNASISQCKRVDVWSWKDGKVLYSYLDVDDILSEKMTEVPEPTPAEIPPYWAALARQKIGESGTLVVWSDLDRVRWKSSKSLLENSEAVVGRMYRYFIDNHKARIRLASFEDGGSTPVLQEEWDVRPNDPVYLMEDTSAPAPYDKTVPFDLYGEEEIEYTYLGRKHKVKLRMSVTKQKVREEGGSSEIGRHAAKNQGVSIVRARREMQLNRTFDNRSDTRERWWGAEVLFSPGLDEVFGVTNNKQEATAFFRMVLDEDAELEGLTPEEYKRQLEENQDPRLIIYDISGKIDKSLHTIRDQIKRMREGARTPGATVAPSGSAAAIATKATAQRREKYGSQGKSDKQEGLSEGEKLKIIAPVIQHAEGVTPEQAKEIATEILDQKVKFLFIEGPLPGSMLFDVQSEMGGPIVITINSRHPARDHFFELLRDNARPDAETPGLRGLKLLFSAWARLEDEATTPQRKRQFEDLRLEWGIIARDFMEGLND